MLLRYLCMLNRAHGNSSEKESSPYYRCTHRNWHSERWSVQGQWAKRSRARIGAQLSCVLILCSSYCTKLPFSHSVYLMWNIQSNGWERCHHPHLYCKEHWSKEFYSMFSFGKPNMLYFIFFTIYLNISHIQNRYNLIFLLVRETRLLWNHGRGWKWDWQETSAEFKEEDNVGQMNRILLFRDTM